MVQKCLAIEHVPRITDFCICIYVFGCRLSLFGLCDSDFGITPQMILLSGSLVLCFASTQRIFHSQFLVFALFFIYYFGEIMCVRDSCVYQVGGLCFFIRESYISSVSRYCFIRNYAAHPVQLDVVVLQYISWCVPLLWTFVFNQFSCFCQFLVDNVCYSVMSFCILGRLQLLTCCSNVLDRLRFFSTSSARLISFWLFQNTFLIVSFQYDLFLYCRQKVLCFGEKVRSCHPSVRRFYVYMLLAEFVRVSAVYGFLGPLSFDFVIVFYYYY